MNHDALYEKYKKEIEKKSNGLISTNQEEFIKLIYFYELMEREEKNRQLVTNITYVSS